MAGKRAVQYLVERGGRFWARVVVPADVREVIGAKELREPLGGDRAKANWTCGIVAGKFLKRIADARAFKGLPVQASAAALAQRYYAELLAIDQTMRADHRNVSVGINDRRVDELRDVSAGRLPDTAMAEIVAPMIDVFRQHGVNAEPGTPAWRELARLVASVELEVLRRVAERDAGEPETPPTLPILVDKPPEAKAKVPLLDLLDAYLTERAHLGKGAEARKRWTPVFKQFVAHLGHDDAEAVTSKKAEEWLSSVLKLKAAKTVRDTDLGSLKAVYRWAKRRKRVSQNPFEEVRLDAPRKVRTREAGFTDTEALAVLKAANAHPAKAGSRESRTLTAAKRWTPWLCAFSGARIAEMTQLRKEDVRTQDGIHFVRITPEAGSVKTGSYRDVPLHPQLIEMGFLAFVEAAPDGPLFYNTDRERSSSASHPSKQVAGRLSDWVRKLKIVGDVQPNHGWRHRFTTVALEAGANDRVLRAIQGHAGKTAADHYGDVTLKAKAAAIAKMPRYHMPITSKQAFGENYAGA